MLLYVLTKPYYRPPKLSRSTEEYGKYYPYLFDKHLLLLRAESTQGNGTKK